MEGERAGMEQTPESVNWLVAETDKLIFQYKQNIRQLIQSERSRLKELIEERSANTVAEACQKVAEQIIEETKNAANEEGARIITTAQQQAESTITEAERQVKEEAKKKTKQEVERLIQRGKEESAKIVRYAKLLAEKESDKVISKSRKDADQLVRDISKSARSEAQQEAARIITEAKQKATKITADAAKGGKREWEQQLAKMVTEVKQKSEREATQLPTEVSLRVEKIIDQAEKEVHAEFGESDRFIAEAREKLGQVTEDANEDTEESLEHRSVPVSLPVAPAGEGTEMAATIVETKPDAAAASMADDMLCKGRIELEIMPPIDFVQIRNLADCLHQPPDIQLVGLYGSWDDKSSEAKNIAVVDVSQPIPLLRLLKEMPPVKSVVQQEKKIGLVLKTEPLPFANS